MRVYKFNNSCQNKFKNSAGIYSIINKLNGKMYIGSTKNLRKRCQEHYKMLINNKHHSKFLQNAFNKYGEKHFGFCILERCEPIVSTLLFVEQKYIDELGYYNVCKTAGSPAGVEDKEKLKKRIAEQNRNRIYTPQMIENIRFSQIESAKRRNIGKSIVQLDLEDNVIAEFYSIRDAARQFGHENCRFQIKKCCRGKGKTAYGYKWRYKE